MDHRGPDFAGTGGAAEDATLPNNEEEDDDDCIILETNPFMGTSSIADHSKRPSSSPTTSSSRGPQHDSDDDDGCVILVHYPFEARRPPTSLSMRQDIYIFIGDDDDDDDDCCIVREPNSEYVEVEVINDIFDLCEKLSSQRLQGEDISIMGERGQVACRDYPHSRHHCVQYPFNSAPHESCCDQCYCFVCETKAPCQYWKNTVDGHCDASELESKWKEMRDANRLSRTS